MNVESKTTSGQLVAQHRHESNGRAAFSVEKDPTTQNGHRLISGFEGIEQLAKAAEVPPEPPELSKLWDIRTLEDAYQPRPPLQYVIDKLIPKASLCIVYGAPGSLKSMVLADACVCVAAGIKWLEPLPIDEAEASISFATTQTPVLWIDYDNGTRRTDERFDALARARNLPAQQTPLHYVSMQTPWVDASSRLNTQMLSELITHLGAGLVVVDNLGLITGEVEENSAGMSQVMGNLRWIAERTGAAVVVIHHQRKAGTGSDKIRKGETLRGHSSIEAALDLALVVERLEGTERVAVVPTKQRGFNSPAFGARFTYKHREGSYDLETARFFSEKIETEQERENKEIEFTIKSELRKMQQAGQQPNKGALVDAVRDSLSLHGAAPGVNKVRGVLAQLERDGAITVQTGERNAKYYRLEE